MMQMEELLLRSRRLPWAVWVLVLIVLALAILLTARPVRDGIRTQMVQREGEVLQAVLVARLDDLVQEGLGEDPEDPAAQLGVLLGISRLEGVLGIRLFDAEGWFMDSFPPWLKEQDTPAAVLESLRALQSVTRYVPGARLADQFYSSAAEEDLSVPEAALLRIYVPLHTSSVDRPLGLAEFVVDGTGMKVDLAQLDRRMLSQGLAVFAVGGVLLTMAMGWSFRRLHRLHGELGKRTESLLRANAELALAARSASTMNCSVC